VSDIIIFIASLTDSFPYRFPNPEKPETCPPSTSARYRVRPGIPAAAPGMPMLVAESPWVTVFPPIVRRLIWNMTASLYVEFELKAYSLT
jgi:hypothetical protein